MRASLSCVYCCGCCGCLQQHTHNSLLWALFVGTKPGENVSMSIAGPVMADRPPPSFVGFSTRIPLWTDTN